MMIYEIYIRYLQSINKFQCTSKNEAGILGMLVHTLYIFDLLLNHEQSQADSLTCVVPPDRTTVLDLVALFRVHSYLNVFLFNQRLEITF